MRLSRALGHGSPLARRVPVATLALKLGAPVVGDDGSDARQHDLRERDGLVGLGFGRQKIGIVFGNPETTTGGTALKFYSSLRIEVRRSAQIKLGDKIIGNRVKVKIVKNKVAPPFRTTEFDIMYNEGISIAGDMLDTGVLLGVVGKSGNSYSFGEEKLGVGRENAKMYLKEHPKLMAQIRKQVMAKVKAGVTTIEEVLRVTFD